MTPFSIFLIFSGLLLLEILYFRISRCYNIIDKPNERSSHVLSTIRGGGIIFVLGALIFFFFNRFDYPFFISGLLFISFVSLMDDILTLNSRIRLVIHLLSVGLMFYQLGLFVMPWYWLIMLFVFVIGTINAYNFMDGINGITGSYSLITIGTFYYINKYTVTFTSPNLLLIIAMSLIVFNIYNFRTKAVCFAGDVGSVSIAFIILFLLMQLIIKTGNFNYLMLILIYGLDTVSTILFRLLRKENIFEAHRSHFYQYCANEYKIPHLFVASCYSLIQLSVNVAIIYFLPDSIFLLLTSLIASSGIFVTIRFATEGSVRLLKNRII